MSDERDDETQEPTEGAEAAPDGSEQTDGIRPEVTDAGGAADEGGADESFEIVEQTPPPPSGDESEPTAVDVTPVPDPPPPPPPPAEAPPVAAPPVVPPPSEPPVAPPPTAVDEGGPAQGWPTAAKVLVVILAVLTVAGIVASIIGFSRASSAEGDADSRGTQLDEAIARNDILERELEETETARDELARENNDLVAQRAELLTSLADAQTELEVARAELEAERARLEDLLVGAAGELEELQALFDEFPRTVDVDLGAADIGGTYRLEFTEIGCSGLDICGNPPAPIAGTLQTSGGLRLIVPDLLDVPLPVVAGTPFGAADSQAVVPPCGDQPRPASLTMALFDDSLEVDADGSVDVTSLGATVVIDAPEFAECGIGRVWYRVAMQPTG